MTRKKGDIDYSLSLERKKKQLIDAKLQVENYSDLFEFDPVEDFTFRMPVWVNGDDDPYKQGWWFLTQPNNPELPTSWVKGNEPLPFNQIVQVGSFSFNETTFVATLGATTSWVFNEAGINYVVASQNLTLNEPDATFPRADIIVWSLANGYEFIEGVAAEDFAIPNTPVGKILVQTIIRNVDGSVEPTPPDLSNYVTKDELNQETLQKVATRGNAFLDPNRNPGMGTVSLQIGKSLTSGNALSLGWNPNDGGYGLVGTFSSGKPLVLQRRSYTSPINPVMIGYNEGDINPDGVSMLMVRGDVNLNNGVYKIEGTPYSVASTVNNGFLTSTDWNTFNNKQNALGFTPENTANKGNANGYAELDSGGKVPASQLPGFVDDVLEFANLASFPATGASGVIYIAVDTNITYRWGGTSYVPIGSDLALGETSSTAYRGDRGKIAYDHSQDVTTNPHNVTKAQVGLSNVDNTNDANKPVSIAQQAALNFKKGILGDIYSKKPLTSDYSLTNPQSTFSFDSLGLTTGGGNNDSLNFAEYNYWTNASHWQRRIVFKSLTAGNGIGIGLNSTNGKIIGRIILTGANNGRIVIDTFRSTTTQRAISTAAISYSSSDDIELIFERSLMYYSLRARNITTGQIIFIDNVDSLDNGGVQFSIWNAAKPAIYHYGGVQLVTYDEYKVNDYTQNQLLIYGNSIAAGAFAQDSKTMFYSLLRNRIPDGATLIAGGGNTTNEYIKLRPEIISLKPRIILFTDGINDLRSGVTLATTQANITTFINDCLSNNITPVICTVLYVATSVTGTGTNAQLTTDINTLNTWIKSLPVKVIDTNLSLSSGTVINPSFDCGDGLHLNASGNIKYYETVISAIPELLGIVDFVDNNNVYVDFTSNRTLILTDGSKVLRGNSASNINITIPPDSSVNFDIGTKIIIKQVGLGQLTILPGSGVTLNSSFSRNKTSTKDAVAYIWKDSANTWTLGGDITT